MFLHKSNFLFRAIYPEMTWRIPKSNLGESKVIYLTFDDGPIPEVTEFVLDNLKQFEAKASFFCIGDNIYKHPTIMEKVIAEGHLIGNHTFNHLRGWKTENELYHQNFLKCETWINQHQGAIRGQKPKFRPPHGRIKKSQAAKISATHEIIMWDVLTGDFSQNLSPETVLQKSIKYTDSGSIVVFHDSIKANKNMTYALPRYLAHFKEKGYEFRSLA